MHRIIALNTNFNVRLFPSTLQPMLVGFGADRGWRRGMEGAQRSEGCGGLGAQRGCKGEQGQREHVEGIQRDMDGMKRGTDM